MTKQGKYNKTSNMNDEEYENYCKERLKLEKEIDHTSLLMSTIHEEGKCPFCHSNIESLDEIREKHIQKMRKYNELMGYKYYVAHVEGGIEWKI